MLCNRLAQSSACFGELACNVSASATGLTELEIQWTKVHTSAGGIPKSLLLCQNYYCLYLPYGCSRKGVCRPRMVYFSPCCQKVIILCLVGNVLLLVTAPIWTDMAFSVYMLPWFNVCVKFTKDRRIYCDVAS